MWLWKLWVGKVFLVIVQFITVSLRIFCFWGGFPLLLLLPYPYLHWRLSANCWDIPGRHQKSFIFHCFPVPFPSPWPAGSRTWRLWLDFMGSRGVLCCRQPARPLDVLCEYCDRAGCGNGYEGELGGQAFGNDVGDSIWSVFEEGHGEFLNFLGALSEGEGTLEETAYSLVGNRIEELMVVIYKRKKTLWNNLNFF